VGGGGGVANVQSVAGRGYFAQAGGTESVRKDRGDYFEELLPNGTYSNVDSLFEQFTPNVSSVMVTLTFTLNPMYSETRVRLRLNSPGLLVALFSLGSFVGAFAFLFRVVEHYCVRSGWLNCIIGSCVNPRGICSSLCAANPLALTRRDSSLRLLTPPVPPSFDAWAAEELSSLERTLDKIKGNLHDLNSRLS